jgi:hypothetical protein
MSLNVNLHEAVISPDNFTNPPLKSCDYYQTRLRFGSHSDGGLEALQKILKQLSRLDLPGKEHAEGYLRHMARSNRRPRTLHSRWVTCPRKVVQFLC